MTAGLVVVAGTATCILVVGLLSGKLAWPTAAQVAAMPWWAWLGGILGGCIILAQFLVARQIGAAPFLGLLVTAGVVTSIVLDNFGWVGFERHPASVWRILRGLLNGRGRGPRRTVLIVDRPQISFIHRPALKAPNHNGEHSV